MSSQLPTLARTLCVSRSVLKSLVWLGHCALEAEVFLTPYSSPDTVHWKQKCSQDTTMARTLCTGSRSVLKYTVHWKQKCYQPFTLAQTLCTGSRSVLKSLIWPRHCALEAEVFSSPYSGLDTVHWKLKCSQDPTLARTLCIGSRLVLK